MAVYRSLAEVNNEEELGRFQEGLEDRFGPITPAVERLLHSKRLIWAGKHIGFERVVFKSKKLIGYFLPDQESSYFQSPKFTKVLQYVQSNPNRVQMRERNGRLSLVFTNVSTLDKAIATLEEVMKMESAELL